MEISPTIVGQKVQNAAKPEWGVGQVLRVQKVATGWRVSVQFPSGHRHLLVPPGRLVAPQAEKTRSSAWLDEAAGETLDAKLTRLPEDIEFFLGTALGKLKAMLTLYEIEDDEKGLEKWARRQTGVGQPLTTWTRDELAERYAQFCATRDKIARETIIRIRKAGEISELKAVLREATPRVINALRFAAPGIDR
ncbi:MAG: DUF3553 domain-containing protein [Phycisphaerae bacterium]